MTMLPLDRGQLSVLRVRAFVVALVLITASLIVDAGPLRQTAVPFGATSGAAAILLILWASWSPGRRYRSWGYKVEDEELHLRYGVWTRVRTVVPFGRVQHIDVAQGPIQRPFGLATLVLHTAGTAGATVSLPGLKQGRAEEMRDLIRRQIRLEPE